MESEILFLIQKSLLKLKLLPLKEDHKKEVQLSELVLLLGKTVQFTQEFRQMVLEILLQIQISLLEFKLQSLKEDRNKEVLLLELLAPQPIKEV